MADEVDLEDLIDAIERGDRVAAVEVTQAAIGAALDPQTILDAMTEAMDIVGDRFQANEIFVPEMLISARAMKAAAALIEPLMAAAGLKPEHVAVVGTVKGDLHDIGKNLVGMMWKGANFEVVDLGVDVPPERFVEAVAEHRAELVGVSALLTTTMPGMRQVVEAVHAAHPGVKVLIGGAPVTREFATQIGADGYAADAGAAVGVARGLLA